MPLRQTVNNSLTLLAPGATPTASPSLVLLDDTAYPARVFDGTGLPVAAGEGVLREGRDDGPVFRLADAHALESLDDLSVPVLFFATTDTDVKSLAPVARRFPAARFLVHRLQDDSARDALEREGFAFDLNRPGARLPQASVAVFSSDAEPHRRECIRRCHHARIPTLCLQEAVNVDFDGPPHRMQWAATTAIMGPRTLRYLRRDITFLTGNPRFDDHTPAPLPAQPKVLINCNFMLGFGGERGREWIDRVMHAVKTADVPFAVTKHPRDDTDLTGIPNVLTSGAYRVADQLAECTVLVSRDSSLPYEALLMHRPVIYFDPFHEKERTLREDSTGLIEKCSNAKELGEALTRILRSASPHDDAGANDALDALFTAADGRGAVRVARAIATLATWPERYKTTDARTVSPAQAIWEDAVQLRLRPVLRRVPGVRGAWRTLKRMRHRT